MHTHSLLIRSCLVLGAIFSFIFSEDSLTSISNKSSDFRGSESYEYVNYRERRRLFAASEVKNFGIYSKGYLCSELMQGMYPFSCNRQLKILVIPQYTIFPTQQGCDKRVYHVLEMLQGLGHQLYIMPFARTHTKMKDDDEELLAELDANFFFGFITQNRTISQTYSRLLYSAKPDIVMMWLWFWDMKNPVPEILMPLTRTMAPNAKVIVMTDDVHSKREQQIAEQYAMPAVYSHYKKRAGKMRKVEKNVYSRSDLVIAISEADSRDIIGLGMTNPNKIKHVSFVNSPWDDPTKQSGFNIPGWGSRKNLVFVGNGENPTNIHALRWYISVVAPEMDKGVSGVICHVIGPAWEGFQKANKGSFEKFVSFKGELSSEEMGNVIDSARVFISPIRASTGINTKNVLALSRGIPLVTTPAGACGMCKKCDDALLRNPLDPFDISDQSTPEDMPLFMGRDMYDFALKAIRLYYEEKLWNEYSAAGLRHVNKWFGREGASRELDNALSAAISGVRGHDAPEEVDLEEAFRLEKGK